MAARKPAKVVVSRWTEDEKLALQKLVETGRDASVEDLAAAFCKSHRAQEHSLDAIKQRIFKLRREGPLEPRHSRTLRSAGTGAARGKSGELSLLLHGAVVNGTPEQLIKVLSTIKTG